MNPLVRNGASYCAGTPPLQSSHARWRYLAIVETQESPRGATIAAKGTVKDKMLPRDFQGLPEQASLSQGSTGRVRE